MAVHWLIKYLIRNAQPTINSYITLHLQPVTSNKINKIINDIDPNKFTGPDNISPKIIKNITDILTDTITTFGDVCFERGVYPEQFNLAEVIRISKVNDPRELQTNFDYFMSK